MMVGALQIYLPKDKERFAAFRTKAKHGKGGIEGRNSVNTQTPHHGEARAIHKSWSRQETPISQATSRSASLTVSITVIPVRKSRFKGNLRFSPNDGSVIPHLAEIQP